MISAEEGLSILRKIHEESSRIYVQFVEHNKAEDFLSQILRIEDGVLFLQMYQVAAFLVDLEGAEFKYEDPREAAHPESAGRNFDCRLTLCWDNGATCRLTVVQDDFDPVTLRT
jgi:hypothetical protein